MKTMQSTEWQQLRAVVIEALLLTMSNQMRTRAYDQRLERRAAERQREAMIGEWGSCNRSDF